MKFYSKKNKRIREQKFSFSKKWVIIFFLAIAAVGAVVYLVIYSPLFIVKNIQVAMADSPANINREELIEKLKQFFEGRSFADSILGSRNILTWDNDLSQFLDRHPQWEFLKISKDYFGRQIIISGKERKKFGLWCEKTQVISEENSQLFPEPKCRWFDEKGVIFSEAPSVESEIFNRVDDYSGRKLEIGSLVLSDEMIRNLIAIFKILEDTGVNARTLILKDLPLEEVSVEPKSGPRLIFGLNRDQTFIAPAINSLRASGQWDKLQYVNFTVENRAYYKK